MRATPRLLMLVLTCLGLTCHPARADHDTACRNTPGVNLVYADHRLEAGDVSAALEVIPLEQRLPGLDWFFFMNQVAPAQSFMYPPQWQPSVIPTDVFSGDSGVRLDAPHGAAALEVFMDVESPFAPRGPVAIEDVVAFALAQVLDDTSYQVLCRDDAISPALASTGVQNLFVAVSTATHLAVVKAIVINSPLGPALSYIVYGGPIGDFEALVRYVFVPVLHSFPKPGGGSCNDCTDGEPDRDDDGVCDRCDAAPDDPNRW